MFISQVLFPSASDGDVEMNKFNEILQEASTMYLESTQ